MIRKEFLHPLVDERLSAFHMKTALLFTVEQFPEDIWRDDNLVQCVIYCLNTLKRFLKTGYCPHSSIDSVNLFAGKPNVNVVNIVKHKVTDMINSGLSCLLTLNMDYVGKRLEFNRHKIPGLEIQFETIRKMMTGLLNSHIFADVGN
ncbi:hypothetical protein DPMN_089486 [Dreissena polymorpha]|uniref:Mab-21-like HhH/H2TH-like domain-containing protein n=1 Tax=Dreissena polymorpha TaxID=45954 RepID=A0A9D4QXG5_DREPO|nr:hypothetical protein DPMN_089486 [Dreissena polymorpha]